MDCGLALSAGVAVSGRKTGSRIWKRILWRHDRRIPVDFKADGSKMVPGKAMEGETMQKIGTYNGYQNNVYETAQTGRNTAGSKAANTRNTASAKEDKTPALSKAAQKLLKDLQKKYSNMDFMVADYETEEEAAAYLSKGTSDYSTLLTPEELEKMAADDSVKEKNLKTLDEAVSKLDDMKKQLGDEGENVTRVGMVIGKDGDVSFFAELEKSSEKQRERIEQRREDNRAASKEAKKADAAEMRNKPVEKPGKRTTVFAPSVEELAEKIGQVDWDKVKDETYGPVGNHLNLTI